MAKNLSESELEMMEASKGDIDTGNIGDFDWANTVDTTKVYDFDTEKGYDEAVSDIGVMENETDAISKHIQDKTEHAENNAQNKDDFESINNVLNESSGEHKKTLSEAKEDVIVAKEAYKEAKRESRAEKIQEMKDAAKALATSAITRAQRAHENFKEFAKSIEKGLNKFIEQSKDIPTNIKAAATAAQKSSLVTELNKNVDSLKGIFAEAKLTKLSKDLDNAKETQKTLKEAYDNKITPLKEAAHKRAEEKLNSFGHKLRLSISSKGREQLRQEQTPEGKEKAIEKLISKDKTYKKAKNAVEKSYYGKLFKGPLAKADKEVKKITEKVTKSKTIVDKYNDILKNESKQDKSFGELYKEAKENLKAPKKEEPTQEKTTKEKNNFEH